MCHGYNDTAILKLSGTALAVLKAFAFFGLTSLPFKELISDAVSFILLTRVVLMNNVSFHGEDLNRLPIEERLQICLFYFFWRA